MLLEQQSSSSKHANKEEQTKTRHTASSTTTIINHQQPCAHKSNLRPFSCITSSTLPDFYHRQHQASHHTIQRVFSVRRTPTKQNHRGLFLLFKPLPHNHQTRSHSNRPTQLKQHFWILHSNTTHTIANAPPLNHRPGCNDDNTRQRNWPSNPLSSVHRHLSHVRL